MRTSTKIITTYIIMHGLIQKGFILHGPFDTEDDAVLYCGKNFPNDTAIIMPMNKEIHTHGEDT